MTVAEEQGSPGADVVDIFVTVRIEDVCAFAAGDEARGASYAAPGTYGGIDAARDGELGAFEKLLGDIEFH